jgi:hypothetical protein
LNFSKTYTSNRETKMIKYSLFLCLPLWLTGFLQGANDNAKQQRQEAEFRKVTKANIQSLFDADFDKEYANEKTPDWTKGLELSGSFRLRGKAYGNIATPNGSFWLEEGKGASGYKLLQLDLSKSQPRALIEKDGERTWLGLRTAASIGATDKEFAKGKLSREDGGETPRIAYFKTNGGNYGKLVFQWQNGTNSNPSGKEQVPILLIKEIITYDARSETSRTIKDIKLSSAGHMDLDSGIASGSGTRLPDDYSPDLHFSNVDGVTMYIRGTDGSSFLFPVSSSD